MKSDVIDLLASVPEIEEPAWPAGPAMRGDIRMPASSPPASPPLPEESDEALMERIRAQDDAALATMYRRYAPLLRAVMSPVVHNEADIDDLLQEVFLSLWNRAECYDRNKGRPLGWLVTLARRRAIDKERHIQAYFRAEERLRLETETAPEMKPDQSVEDAVNAAYLAELFRPLLAALPVAQREAVDLAYYRGLSQREIAARTGTPLDTIKTRLELALRKLRVAFLSLDGAEEWA